MSVNRAWRGVASGAPQLWKRLVFDREDHSNTFTWLTHVRTHLQNSGAGPLDIRIIPAQIEDITAVAALFREHVSRLRTLDVHVQTQADAESFISSAGEGQPAPILEQLNISVAEVDDGDARTFVALQKSFHPAPKLFHLGLPAHPLPVKETPLLAPIKSLALDNIACGWSISMDHTLDFVEALPHLQHFTFKSSDVFSYTTTSEIDYPRIISMPNLISADVSAPGCGLDIIRIFDAPLLTDVRFDGQRDEDGEYCEKWPDSLTMPISASLRRLSDRSLKIKRIELHDTRMFKPLEDFRWLLSDDAFPELEVLRFDSTDILDDALEGARGLKRLELRACDPGVTGAGLLRFVEGRSECFELLLDSCPGVTQEDIDALSKVVKVESKYEIG